MKKAILLLACFMLCVWVTTAQTVEKGEKVKSLEKVERLGIPQSILNGNFVCGTVTDEAGKRLEHVLVLVKGTVINEVRENGHYTNESGYFHFEVPKGTTTLVVTQDGYETIEAPAVKGIQVMIKKRGKYPQPETSDTINKINVSGTIKDDSGRAAIGVKVKVHGASGEFVTARDGKFYLKVPKNARFLIVNGTGFLEQGVQFAANNGADVTGINVTMKSFIVYKTEQRLNMNNRDEHLLTAPMDDVTWQSSNPSVVTVGTDGLLTPRAVGSATVTAFRKNKAEKCKVIVRRAPR